MILCRKTEAGTSFLSRLLIPGPLFRFCLSARGEGPASAQVVGWEGPLYAQ